MKKEFNYEVVKEIKVLKDYSRKNMKKEINLIRWNKDNEAKLDIRYWIYNENGSKKPGKGFTLSKEEISLIVENGKNYIEEIENSVE